MDKNEILQKAKKENQKCDEREFDIEKTSNLVAYITTVTILGVLAIIGFVQKINGLQPIVEINVISFIFLSILATKYATMHYYYKSAKYLWVSIIASVGSLCSVAIYFI